MPGLIVTTNDKFENIMGPEHRGKYFHLKFSHKLPDIDQTLKQKTNGFRCARCGADFVRDGLAGGAVGDVRAGAMDVGGVLGGVVANPSGVVGVLDGSGNGGGGGAMAGNARGDLNAAALAAMVGGYLPGLEDDEDALNGGVVVKKEVGVKEEVVVREGVAVKEGVVVKEQVAVKERVDVKEEVVVKEEQVDENEIGEGFF